MLAIIGEAMALTVKIKDTSVAVGDTVMIGERFKEGDKNRIQRYQGVVTAIKGNRHDRTVTVRRIAAAGIGVEKIFPVDMPGIASVKVLGQARVRRAKLYYLRDRVGKAALKLKDRPQSSAGLGSRRKRGARKKDEVKKTDEAKPAAKSRKPRRKRRPKPSSR